MESYNGRLFIGGLSWDTNEDRLRKYFSAYGEVVEAVIMKDRTTGLSRCFGFVVFADSTAAERVLAKKHKIDGFVVEAKQAVPRDDLQAALNRPAGGSPGAKIFVCGLASTVTKSDLRGYFKQFGTITNSVVACDFNTRRPRGFGFVTNDSEDAVDKVLLRGTFHKLKGKTVEVKRSVPKKLSAGPTVGDRSPIVNFSHGLNSCFHMLPGNNSKSYSSSRMDPRIGGIIPSLRTNIEQERPNLLNYNESMNPPYLLGANSGSRFFNSVLGSGFSYTPNSGDHLRPAAQVQSNRGSSSSGYGLNFGVIGNSRRRDDSPLQIQSNNSRRRRIDVSAAGSLPSANAPYEHGYPEIEVTRGWNSFDFVISNHLLR